MNIYGPSAATGLGATGLGAASAGSFAMGMPGWVSVMLMLLALFTLFGAIVAVKRSAPTMRTLAAVGGKVGMASKRFVSQITPRRRLFRRRQ